jgi:G:T/U-mismatch repair DNA glycosylase
VIETNPFRAFLPPDPRILILGSFPCFNGTDYGHWYYSGSGRSHFWTLLSDVFGMPAGTLHEKRTLCREHGIALSDVAWRVRRRRGDCSDANLRILEFNEKGVSACLDAGVKKVFFTSRFVGRHFNALFPGCKLPVFLLPSPSPAANKHIGGLSDYKALRTSGRIGSAYEYRLLKYRELLQG